MYSNPVIPGAATGVILASTGMNPLLAVLFSVCAIFALISATGALKRSLPVLDVARNARGKRRDNLLAQQLAKRISKR